MSDNQVPLAVSDARAQQPGNLDDLRGHYQYPRLGEPHPPGGETVLLLTEGGICISGMWADNAGFIGWCRRPERDMAKEQAIATAKSGHWDRKPR